MPLSVAFFLTPRLLHLLGPERFGVLMVALVTPAIASQMDLGLASSAVRRFAADLKLGRLDGPGILSTYFVSFCVLALVFGAVVAVASDWLADALGFSALLGAQAGHQLTRWCAVWGAVSLATALPSLLVRAAQSFAWLTAVQTLATLVVWVGALMLIGAQRPLHDIVVLGIVTSILAAATMTLAARHMIRWSGWPVLQLPVHKKDMRFAGGMFSAQIASAVVYQGDRILISSFGSPAVAGAYALCANLANKPLAAVVAITAFAFPHASGLHAGGEKAELAALLHALDRAVAVLIIPLILPALWLAGVFLQLWLGAYGTADLALAFRILMIAFAVPAFAVPVGHVLAASGNAEPAARFSWLTALVVVLGITVLVPRWGLLGAVVAILAGMSTSLIFSVVARRMLRLEKPQGRLRFCAGVLLGLATQAGLLGLFAPFAVDWWTLFAVALAAWAVFFFTRAMFHTLSPEEIRLSRRLCRRIPPLLGRKH